LMWYHLLFRGLIHCSRCKIFCSKNFYGAISTAQVVRVVWCMGDTPRRW